MKCRAAVLCKCLKTKPATPVLSSEDTHRDLCCSAAASERLGKAPCSEALACSFGVGQLLGVTASSNAGWLWSQ